MHESLPKHVAEFLREELGLSLKQARKCVDRDFVAVLSAILLADGKRFSHSVYNIADNWRILHVWMPDIGSGMVLITKFEKFENDYMLEECYMVEEE